MCMTALTSSFFAMHVTFWENLRILIFINSMGWMYQQLSEIEGNKTQAHAYTIVEGHKEVDFM